LGVETKWSRLFHRSGRWRHCGCRRRRCAPWAQRDG